ncbi:MAG: FAD-binding protein, partial [Planctomycetota bacterium]
WTDYERTAEGGLKIGSPRNQQTSIPRLYAIGECDYHYHGANRLGANSLLSCIFSGLMVSPSIGVLIENLENGDHRDVPSSLYETVQKEHQRRFDEMLARGGEGENPYQVHRELGEVMTRAATVVRHNDELDAAYATVCELEERARRAGISDTSTWTNQNVVFARALVDMFPLAKTILKGARLRDECRGAHYKPEFAMPEIHTDDPAEARRQAEAWCDRFEENNRRWLKSTIAVLNSDGDPEISYEEVDTSLIPPRPRLYGLVGAEVIEEVWQERQTARESENRQD